MELTIPKSTDRLAARLRSNETTISFDKDDDDTLDFVTAASNLRSAAYGIDGKSRWEIKGQCKHVANKIEAELSHRKKWLETSSLPLQQPTPLSRA